jgi:hypothetical protein
MKPSLLGLAIAVVYLLTALANNRSRPPQPDKSKPAVSKEVNQPTISKEAKPSVVIHNYFDQRQTIVIHQDQPRPTYQARTYAPPTTRTQQYPVYAQQQRTYQNFAYRRAPVYPVRPYYGVVY